MNKLFFLLFLPQLFIFAQIQDLAIMSTGSPAGFSSLTTSNDKFYGYISFFYLGEEDEKQKSKLGSCLYNS